MSHLTKALFIAPIIVLTLFSPRALSEESESGGRVDVTNTQEVVQEEEAPKKKPRVGRNAAEKYMSKREPAATSSSSSSGASDHYLALHLGTFVSDSSYRWGARDSDTNNGKLTLGLTYRMGEWVNSMDLAIRVDFNTYSLTEGSASKLSFLPVIMFPDASSKFPIYFGIGGGLGVFTKQITNESSISFDYQLLVGARFFDIFRNTGFFVEAGLKNHIHLLSDGQSNGTFVAAGTVFTF